MKEKIEKINKEKLLKYIEENFIRSDVIFSFEEDCKPAVTFICNFITLNLENKPFTLEVEILTIYRDNKFFLKYTIQDNSLFPSSTVRITEDIYNELLEFGGNNKNPETKEFYQQICDCNE